MLFSWMVKRLQTTHLTELVFLISPSDIERIEVVKGPGSVLHGSKAIGGVVNIITKKGADRALQVEVGTSFDTSTNGISGFSAASGTVDRWDYRFSLSKDKHGDRETTGGTLEGSSHESQSVSAYVGYNGDQHKFSIKAERYEKEGETYSEPEFPITAIDLQLPKRDRSKIAFFYDFKEVSESIANIHLDGYFQQIDRIATNNYTAQTPFGTFDTVSVRENKIESELYSLGLNGQVDLTLADQHLTTAGFQAVQDRLDKVSTSIGSDDPFGPAPETPFSDRDEDEAKLTTLSAFLQDEWDITEELTLTGGGRYYFVQLENDGSAGDKDENDQAFVGAFGLNYVGFENLAFRAHLSQGYVYPTLLHSTTGSIFSPAGQIFGNSDLDPETSVTAEIGGRYDDGLLVIDVSAYYTDAKDYIDTVRCDPASHGSKCTAGSLIYENIDSAKTWGLELAASYQIDNWGLTPYANLALMRRQFNTSSTSTFHTDTPLFSGRVGVTKEWDFDSGVNAYADLYSRFASERRLVTSREDESEAGFATLNLAGGFSYDFDDERKLKVNAAVENIFDLEYKPSLDELTAPGRTFKLSASVIF